MKKIKRWKEDDQARVYSTHRAQRPERKRDGKKERRDCEGEVRQSEWTRMGDVTELLIQLGDKAITLEQ